MITLLPLLHATLVHVPQGFTCPRCRSVHFIATNQHGRTYCPTCLPEEVCDARDTTQSTLDRCVR